MTTILRRSLFGLAVLLTVGGCKGNQRTELVVQVGSNLAVPGELDKVDLAVTANGNTQHTPYSLVSNYTLPLNVGVVEATAGAGSIEIVATGYLSGSPIVNETADLYFVEGQSMLLKLFLAAECRDNPCTDPRQTCTTGGTCVDKVRKPSDLTPYKPGASGGTGGGTGGTITGGADGGATGGSGGSADARVPDAPGSPPDVPIGGAGGGGGTGGNPGTGGTTSAGGTATGGAATGGTTTSGGTTSTGGTTTAGGRTASGGMTSAGGTTTAGGRIASGGTTSAGGTTTAGGTAASGGTTSAGGTTTAGGRTASGGTTSAGGTTTAGGTIASGGSSGSGGASGNGGTWGGTAPSCSGLAATCGPSGTDDCCKSLLVPGGTFDRSYDGVDFLDPNYPATVSDFYLDKYEITVGRFRVFVNAGMGTLGSPPAAGAGAGITGSGWDSTWDTNLAATTAALTTNLKCYSTYQTWTDTAGSNESKPVNCLDWYTAFAFCAWDGGRLATEAEWNYAASGGSEQRYYPWSSPATSTTIDDSYAVYCGGSCSSTQNVGSKSPKGDGKWGQSDLAGNVWEWTLDWYASPYSMPCNNCADLTAASDRVLRGGSFLYGASYLRSANRDSGSGGYPGIHVYNVGSRCARTSL